ncbi:MAG: hypothetical protein H6Q89_5236 [Myxococcaceae bacterium]|nr:hypothetical protein [Myxococcaceae bacterium]
MNRALTSLALLCSATALAANYPSGQVMVVEDTTGAQHDPEQLPPAGLMGTSLCQFAAKGLYTQFSDQYDGVVMFTTNPMNTPELGIQNTMLGNIVRQTDQGISDTAFVSLGGNPAVAYGSPAKLSQCVYMGSLPQLPQSPDDQATTLFGGFIPLGMGITGAELMGHEYGHHWLLWATYDKNDGKGKRYLLRGDTSASPQDPASPNGHYNHYSDARSVMYGSFVTKTGPGAYKLEGGVRKYNHFDQYFMGLRAASEVAPMMIVDDGSNSDRGAAVQPFWRTGGGLTMTGNDFTVDIADVIRAIGPRVPSAATAQKCLRVAFVLVAHQGHVATAAEIAKVDAYRQRFASWWSFATDGRGSMDTSLTGPTAPCQPSSDGGVVVPDAGTPGVDAGPADAGTPAVDAGRIADAGPQTPDASVAFDAGPLPVDPVDAGGPPNKWETLVPSETNKLKPGCGCQGANPGVLALVVLLGLALRRWRLVR